MTMTDSGPLRFQTKRRLRRIRRVVRTSIGSAVDALLGESSLRNAKGASPLLMADRTYNTEHADYEPELVRNFPGYIYNADVACDNPTFIEIKQLARRTVVPPRAWRPLLRDAAEEAATVPGYSQLMERKTYIENYMTELGRRYHAHYIAGWVNLVDAHFLYWLVRRAKPKVIVQTGVSNGLSSAFMMLALAKNGPEGRLHVIDLPAIFNPADSAWTQKGMIYGVVIPERKSSGWIVPDIYRDRISIEIGDAKALLPKLVDRIDSIDMFFHDSDHTYNHMMFEFEQAKRKLAPGGIFVADDISWNASLWDFIDRHRVPGYNYGGSMGTAFFPK